MKHWEMIVFLPRSILLLTSESLSIFPLFSEKWSLSSGGSRQGVLGGSEMRRRQKVFTRLKYPSFSATIVGYHTKVVTFSKPRKWLFVLVDLCDLSGNYHSLKSPFINSQKVWTRSCFSQATPNWERYGCPKQFFISTINVWKIYRSVQI